MFADVLSDYMAMPLADENLIEAANKVKETYPGNYTATVSIIDHGLSVALQFETPEDFTVFRLKYSINAS